MIFANTVYADAIISIIFRTEFKIVWPIMIIPLIISTLNFTKTLLVLQSN